MSTSFVQVLLMLGVAVAVVLVFQELRIPSSLGYLLVGVLLGPHTAGPVIDAAPVQAIAEFGKSKMASIFSVSYQRRAMPTPTSVLFW